MASIFTFTFDDTDTVDTRVDQSIDFTGTGSILTMKLTRYASKLVSAKDNVAQQIDCFRKAIELDYNGANIYGITTTATTLVLEHFDNDHFDSFVDGTHNNTTFITTSLTTSTQRLVISMTNVFSANAANRCGDIDAEITFTSAPDEVTIKQYALGGEQIILFEDLSNVATVIDVTAARDRPFMSIVYKTGGVTTTNLENIPALVEILSVDSFYNSFGGYATINPRVVYGSEDYVYAISDTGSTITSPDYQASPNFSGLTPGNYIAYVKDLYGCVKNLAFNIAESQVSFDVLDYFYSDKNSSMAAYRDMVDETANHFNYLTEEMPHLVSFNGFSQTWGDHQKITNQFLSSYPVHTATIINCETGTETEFAPTLMSDNLRRDTFLEGQVSSGFLGLAVSFTPGDVYDELGNVTGTHDYNATLPLWYDVGVEIKVNGFAGIIEAVALDIAGIDYVVTNIAYTGDIASTTIHTIYQAKDYEVYEMDFDMGALFNTVGSATEYNFRWKLELERASTFETFPPKTILSEVQRIIPEAELTSGKYHITEFWSDEDDEHVKYSTGIRHLRNIPFSTPPKRVSQAEIESQSLGNKTIKLDYSSSVVFEQSYDSLPQKEAETLMDLFDNTDWFNQDGMLCSTIEPVSIETSSQLSKITVKYAVVRMRNEAGTDSDSIAGFRSYPVVTT